MGLSSKIILSFHPSESLGRKSTEHEESKPEAWQSPQRCISLMHDLSSFVCLVAAQPIIPASLELHEVSTYSC